MQQANASYEMAGVTSLPVRVKFWRGAELSGPAIMGCTNVLVSQSKHSKSCYLLSFLSILSSKSISLVAHHHIKCQCSLAASSSILIAVSGIRTEQQQVIKYK